MRCDIIFANFKVLNLQSLQSFKIPFKLSNNLIDFQNLCSICLKSFVHFYNSFPPKHEEGILQEKIYCFVCVNSVKGEKNGNLFRQQNITDSFFLTPVITLSKKQLQT